MKHKAFLLLVTAEIITLTVLLIFGMFSASSREQEMKAGRALASALSLTDLAIWTEARYTRHPSQADLFTPFQDYPSAIEHFPAGSIVVPPRSQQGVR